MKAIADKATWLSMLAIVISCLVVGWHYRSDSTFEDSSSASTDVDADGGAETEPSAEGDSEGSSEVARAAKGKPSRRGDGDGGQTVASYRPGKPDQSFELPVALSEISDLTLAGDGQSLWAVNDEKGTLFRLSTKDGSVLQTIEFHKKGDFEGVALVGEQVFAGRSDGEVFVIETQDGTSTHFSTPLGVTCNVEGLAYQAAPKARLLMACKTPQGDKSSRAWVVLGLSLPSRELEKAPVLTLTRKAIDAYLDEHGKEEDLDGIIAGEADPSGIAVHPTSGAIYLLSTRGRLLITVDPSGTVLRIEKLDRKVHPQPEGIAFAADGTLFISNEGRGQKGLLNRFAPLK